MNLSRLCKKYTSDIRIRKIVPRQEASPVNGKNLLDLMILAANWGETLMVETEGSDAEAALAAVGDFIETDEDMEEYIHDDPSAPNHTAPR